MKKARIFIFMFILVTFAILFDNVKADNRLSSSFANKISATYDGVESQHTIRVMKKTYQNKDVNNQGGKAFCTAYWNTEPKKECSATVWNSDPDKNKKIAVAIGAMINKARNKSTIKPNLDWKTYFYTEMAINEFLYLKNGKKPVNYVRKLQNWSAVLDQSLYNSIFSAGSSAYESYNKTDIAISNAKVSVSDDKKTITATATLKCYNANGKKVTCNLSRKQVVLKINDNEVGSNLEFDYDKSVDKISYSKVLSEAIDDTTKIKVTFTAKNKVKYGVAQNYDCGSGYQSLTPNSIKNLYLEDTAKKTTSYNLYVCAVRMKKEDSDGNPLKGAKFYLCEDQNCSQIIDSGVSEENGEVTLSTIHPNSANDITLYYKEYKAPKGYVRDNSVKSFNCSANSSTLFGTETFINRKETGSIKVSKTDGNGNFVEGAKIKIFTTTLKDVDQGSFNVNEVDEEGEYDFPDDSDENFNYLKFNANGDLDSNGQYDYFITGNGEKVITGLEIGKTYYIYEASTPENGDYAIKKGTEAVDINDTTIQSVELINNHSNFKISKQDITSKEELPGATLQVLDERGNVEYEWISTTEQKEIKGLADGEYTLIETIAPKGYAVSESIKFTIKDGKLADDEDNTLVMYDKLKDVDVPDTLSAKSLILVLVGMVIIASGIGVFLYGVKRKDEI